MGGRAIALLQRGLTMGHRLVSRRMPSHWTLNFCLALPRFLGGNQRLPRPLDHPRATLNDVIFHRMIRHDWSVLQQSCVDKEYAKLVALAKAPGVKVPQTHAVMPLGEDTSAEEVRAWLLPYAGQKLVVKPTHSFGAILYLDDLPGDEGLATFVRYAKRNFFHARREAQYRHLEKKLIIEENLAPDERLNDYKFSCSNGRVLHGRLDVGRFTPDHRRALFTVPDFRIIPVRCGGLGLPDRIEAPPHLAEMIDIAGQLSRGFDFVRVDLYDTPNGVYFGEFTFTPAAGACSYSDEDVAVEMLRCLREAVPAIPALSSAEQLGENGVEPLAPGLGSLEPPIAKLKKPRFA